MKITNIRVSAGRTFNHPFEQYSNLRPEVELCATLDDSDCPESAIHQLQAQAEQLVEDHKQNMLKSIEDLHDLTEHQREMTTLEAHLGKAQARLDEIRKAYPNMQAKLPLDPADAYEEMYGTEGRAELP